jgi:ATP-binding cassette subfamily B protein
MGGYLVIEGHITLGTLVAFVGLLPSFFQPITALATVGQTIQRATGSMQRVLEVLEEPLDVPDRAGAAELGPVTREIRLEGVSFAYDEGRPILEGIDLVIPAGIHAAIVGPSGSGKSTIVNLLLRFWDPTDGCVRFDGRDIRDVTQASLRRQIGLVFQDTFIFDTTLRENIEIGRPGASDADVAAAGEAARLDGYIESLPAGYDTVMGERGVHMSGGQRQRLAIARALVRNPSVLVLDEGTSALDAQTEREILDTLASLAGSRTTISITHRLSVAARADRVYVLEQGRVVEEGPHEQLVRAGGLYQRLYEEQEGEPRLDSAPRLAADTARLRAVPLFAHLSTDELAAVTRLLVHERYPPGADIVRQGDSGDRLYVIEYGQVDVLVEEEHRERCVNTLEEGDYFGELAVLGEQARSATVRATRPTSLLALSRNDFEELVLRDAGIGLVVAATVARRRAALATAVLAIETPAAVGA